MSNERKTESIVRNYLKICGYYDDPDIVVEEQKSDSPKINKLLKNASKKGDKQGYPEFIITSKSNSNFIIVIECKASVANHISDTLDKYADYAVDGALLYASFLAKEYDVLAIAVSGETVNNLLISHYLMLKGLSNYSPYFKNNILSFKDYYEGIIHSNIKFNQDFKELADYSKKLNTSLHAKKIKEAQRSLLISGILIALQNKAFKQSFKSHKYAQNLVDNLVSTIIEELSDANIPLKRIANLKYAFTFIKTQPTLSSDKEFMENLITDIDKKINSFLKTHQYFDAIGQFYIEFLRYANNDKGLGIVLTPPHITDLFVEIAGVNKDSVVLDNCCGTAGFLISAMRKMIKDSQGDWSEIDKIKKNRLIGIEYQDDIYALAISNMIVHGDGKTNIFLGDCFALVNEIKKSFKPTIGLLNPPYKPPDQTEEVVNEEFEFVLNNLEMLELNGKCVAIIPISCALAQTGQLFELKKKLLAKHTLEAVMSVPDQLFHDSDVGVVTCIMVFKAHVPHPKGKKTWFGYWKDDSFVKVKNKGRVDKYNNWDNTKTEWVNMFNNSEVINGYSVMHEVTAKDEWCAEAYMETDYSKLNEDDFTEIIKNYVTYEFFNNKEIK